MADEPSVSAVEQEMGRYYDAEERREDRPLDVRRVAARDRFIEMLTADSSAPVLEIGTGPGRDAVAFAAAGIQSVGVDLSFGHAARAASRGVAMTVASARALPFVAKTFGSMWSMSTLMHVPDAAIETTMRELARVLAPGSPVAIGVWGGPDVEHFSENAADPAKPRRLFSRRSEERWRGLLLSVGRIDDYAVWDDPGSGDDAFRYHLAFLTAHTDEQPTRLEPRAGPRI